MTVVQCMKAKSGLTIMLRKLISISMWALTRSQPRNNPYEITFLSDMELTTVKVRVILYINFSVT